MLKAIIYNTQKQTDGTIVMKPLTSARYLTVPQIAATLGISKQTVYRHIDEGKLSGMRFGASVRISLEEFRKWHENAKFEEYERPVRKTEDAHGH